MTPETHAHGVMRRALYVPRRHAEVFGMPHRHFTTTTDDGVSLSATSIGSNEQVAVVIAHGFLGWRTKPRFRALAESLAQRFTVFTFDLRGHGASGGHCSGGEHEYLDVHALVREARALGFGSVVSVGASLGGIAVLTEAALFKDVDAVVSISAPARWAASDLRPAKRVTWMLSSTTGRRIARHVFGTEIAGTWGDPPPPLDLVADIAPIPLWVIHGSDDHYFPATDARELYAAAGEPARLSVIPRFGHAEDGFEARFFVVLARGIGDLIAG